ncbi:MAG TPA: hypothetical protein PLC52_05350 [Anaerolineales bacterium]|nr:hypothetical protein [Anaerolineales bacterium]
MKSHIRTLLLSIATGTLAAWLLAAFGGPAPSTHLAQQLGMGSGYLLAAILGGLLGLWLTLGGNKRIAGFGGWLLGVLAGWLLWRFGSPHMGLIELILSSAFGEAAAAYTSVVALALFFAAMRIGGAWGQKALAALLDLAQRVRARRQAAAALAAAG